ncbi:MAG: hypothetical protein ACREA0_21735, partial [bacterium]
VRVISYQLSAVSYQLSAISESPSHPERRQDPSLRARDDSNNYEAVLAKRPHLEGRRLPDG